MGRARRRDPGRACRRDPPPGGTGGLAGRPFSTYFAIEHEPPDVGSAQAQSADYYAVERYTRDWGDVEIPCYRRPLSAVTAPVFEAGFVPTDLREPLPQVDDEHLAYFAEGTPRFLTFRARTTR